MGIYKSKKNRKIAIPRCNNALNKFLFTFLLVFASFFSFAQHKFTLKCKTNIIQSGYAILSPSYSNSELYNYSIKNDSVKILNGSFSFIGTLNYPQLFFIKMVGSDNQKYYVEDFFIDKNSQELFIDTMVKAHNAFSIFSQGVSVKKSTTNSEYFDKYLYSFTALNKRTDTIFKNFAKNSKLNDSLQKNNFIRQRDSCRNVRDTMLNRYSLKNKSSNVLPWMLYQHIEKYGYKKIYQNTFDNIVWKDMNLKNAIKNYLIIKRDIDVGKIIPSKVELVNPQLKNDSSIKYILIDFWFSSCHPCLKQFEELRNIYAKFHSLGFEILAVSIDDSGHIQAYKNLLANQKYPWIQYLDTNSVIANKLFIKKFPSNFLVDKEGKILRIDIEPISLTKFLNKEFLK